MTPERQPREQAVPCARCRGGTWNLDAICRGCADRRCTHCDDPVVAVEGGLIHTTNGTVYCDARKLTEAA